MHSDGLGRRLDHKMPEPSLKTRPRNLQLPWLPALVQADRQTNVDRPVQIDAREVPISKKSKGLLLMGFFWLHRSNTRGQRLQRFQVLQSGPGVPPSADLHFAMDRVAVDRQPNQDKHPFQVWFGPERAAAQQQLVYRVPLNSVLNKISPSSVSGTEKLLIRRKRCLCPFAVSFGPSGRSPRSIGSRKSPSALDRENVGGKSWFRFFKGFGSGRKRTAILARISRRKPAGPNQRHYPRNAGR